MFIRFSGKEQVWTVFFRREDACNREGKRKTADVLFLIDRGNEGRRHQTIKRVFTKGLLKKYEDIQM